MAEIDELEEQRRMIFEALQGAGGFFQGENPQALLQQIVGQAQGSNVPFTQDVRNNMLADNASASAGMFNASRDQINRGMANAGLAGSGLQSSALISAQQAAAKQARAGRRDVNTRADLENFAARERGMSQWASFLSQQAQQQQAAAFAEADMRSRMHATGDATNVLAASPGGAQGAVQAPAAAPAPSPAAPRPTNYGLSNSMLQAPNANDQQYRWSGAGLQFTQPTRSFQSDMTSYNTRLQQQQLDRAHLAQLQADWDRQFGQQGV